MERSKLLNAARNLAGGFLAAYGWVSFFCFMVLDLTWTSAAPAEPNPALGLIYRNNNHGSYTYLSAFQATTCALMFETSIPLFFVALTILPKRNFVGTFRTLGMGAKWDWDDPRRLSKKAAIVGALATPILVFTVGPHLIRALNAIGFVLNLG